MANDNANTQQPSPDGKGNETEHDPNASGWGPYTASRNKYFDVHPWVFYPSAVIAVVFIVITIIVGDSMLPIFNSVKNGIANNAGWFFILVVNFFLVFSIFLGFSKFGSIRLGGQDAKPEFSTFGWFAMLFSAGMGIGIMFYSVAEPIYHFAIDPPRGPGGTADAAEHAMGATYLHWGLHAWGIYAMVGMSLAFFAFNKRLPLAIRSVFYPLIGNKIYGAWGNVIDTLAVLATLFGLATSLGLGVQQVSAGLGYLLPFWQDNVLLQILLITLITFGATASVVLGIDKGVKFLSELNLRLGALFLIFVVLVGPTIFILDSFVQNLGYYMRSLLELGFWTESYKELGGQSPTTPNWQNSWTLFYWSWWISWSPFVGMFIARVSKGRTVREFVLAVLLVPSLISFFWLSAFGGSAVFLELEGMGQISGAIQDQGVAVALFKFVEELPAAMMPAGFWSSIPWAVIGSAIGVVLVVNFFITSSDSGSLVVDSLTSGGKVDAPVGQRIFWALTEGAVAAVLLYGSGEKGLTGLQTAVVSTGLPFAFVLLIMCVGLYQGLKSEHEQLNAKPKQGEAVREKAPAQH